MTQKGGQKYNISFCKGKLRNFHVRSNFFRKHLSLNRVLLMKSFFSYLKSFSYYTWFPDISGLSIKAITKCNLQKLFVTKTGEITPHTHINARIMP